MSRRGEKTRSKAEREMVLLKEALDTGDAIAISNALRMAIDELESLASDLN